MAEPKALVKPSDSTLRYQPQPEQPVLYQAGECSEDTRPWLLFDLNGVLVEESNYVRSSGGRGGGGRWRRNFRARPGIASLLLLRSKYRLGLYSSATMPTIDRALDSISYRLFKELESYPERLRSLKEECAAAAAAKREPPGALATTVTVTATAGAAAAANLAAPGQAVLDPLELELNVERPAGAEEAGPGTAGAGNLASAGGDGQLGSGDLGASAPAEAPAAAPAPAEAPAPAPAPAEAPAAAPAPTEAAAPAPPPAEAPAAGGAAAGREAKPAAQVQATAEADAAAAAAPGVGGSGDGPSGRRRGYPGHDGGMGRGARVDARVLFSRILHRSHCRPDPHWRQRPDGREWDTVKPLEEHGLPLQRCLLIDNEAKKRAAGEESNMLTLPTWEAAADQGVAAWLALVTELLALPEEPDLDLRLYSAAISDRLAVHHVPVPAGGDRAQLRARTPSPQEGQRQEPGQQQEPQQSQEPRAAQQLQEPQQSQEPRAAQQLQEPREWGPGPGSSSDTGGDLRPLRAQKRQQAQPDRGSEPEPEQLVPGGGQGEQQPQPQQPAPRPPRQKQEHEQLPKQQPQRPATDTQPQLPQTKAEQWRMNAAAVAAAGMAVAGGAACGQAEAEAGQGAFSGLGPGMRPRWACFVADGAGAVGGGAPEGAHNGAGDPSESRGTAGPEAGPGAGPGAGAGPGPGAGAAGAAEGCGHAPDAAAEPAAKRARVTSGQEASATAVAGASKQPQQPWTQQQRQQQKEQHGEDPGGRGLGPGLGSAAEAEARAAAVLRLYAEYVEGQRGRRLSKKAECAMARQWRHRSGSDPRMDLLMAGMMAAAWVATRGSANHIALLDLVVGRWNKNKKAAECIPMDRVLAAKAVEACLKKGLIRAVPLPGPNFIQAYCVEPESVAAQRSPEESFPKGVASLCQRLGPWTWKQRRRQSQQEEAGDSGSEASDDGFVQTDGEVEQEEPARRHTRQPQPHRQLHQHQHQQHPGNAATPSQGGEGIVADAGAGAGAGEAWGGQLVRSRRAELEKKHDRQVAALMELPPPLLHLVVQGVHELQAIQSVALSDVWSLAKDLVPAVRTAVPQYVADGDLVPRLVRRGVLAVAPTVRFIRRRYFVRQLPEPEVLAEALRSVSAGEPYDEARLRVAGTVWEPPLGPGPTGASPQAKTEAGPAEAGPAVAAAAAATAAVRQGRQVRSFDKQEAGLAQKLQDQRDGAIPAAVVTTMAPPPPPQPQPAAAGPSQNTVFNANGVSNLKRPRPGPDDGPDPSLPGAIPLYGRPWNCRTPARPSQPPPPGRRPLSTLHEEVAAFARESTPEEEELAALCRTLAAVQRVATELWPTSRVVLFGSQAAGLALPGSDLDLVVLGVTPHLTTPAEGFEHRAREDATRLLRKLAKRLHQAGLIRQHEVIRAKVPIVKTHMVPVGDDLRPLRDGGRGGYDVPYKRMAADISIGAANGATTVALIQRAVAWMPPLRPLCLVLKAMLKEEGLNEVFTGGVSSYALVNMVIAHLLCEGYDVRRLLDRRDDHRHQTVQDQQYGAAAVNAMGPGGVGAGSSVGGGSGGPNTGPPAKRRRREVDWSAPGGEERGSAAMGTARKTYFNSDDGDDGAGGAGGGGGHGCGAANDGEDGGQERVSNGSSGDDDDDDSSSTSSGGSSDEEASRRPEWVASDGSASGSSSEDDSSGDGDGVDLNLYIETDQDQDERRRGAGEAEAGRNRHQLDTGPPSPAAWPQPDDDPVYGSGGDAGAFHEAYDRELAAMAEAAAATAEAAAVLNVGRARQVYGNGGGVAVAGTAAAAGLPEAQLSYLRALGRQDVSGADLGELLVGFLIRYGLKLEPDSEAVSILRGGITRKLPAWSSKHRQQQQQQGGRGPLLAVEDPQQRGKDVSCGSFNMGEVLRLFARTAQGLRRAAGGDGPPVELRDEEARERALWAAVQSEGAHRSINVDVEGAASNGCQHPYKLLRAVLDPELALCRSTHGAHKREQHARRRSMQLTAQAAATPGERSAGRQRQGADRDGDDEGGRATFWSHGRKKSRHSSEGTGPEFHTSRSKTKRMKKKWKELVARAAPRGQQGETPQQGSKKQQQRKGKGQRAQGQGEGQEKAGGGKGANGGLGPQGGVNKKRGGKKAGRASFAGESPGSGKRGRGGGKQGSRRSAGEGGGSAGKAGGGRGGWVMV